MNENHSDDQIGRARVQDSPELQAYYKELETLGAGALWTVANRPFPCYGNTTNFGIWYSNRPSW